MHRFNVDLLFKLHGAPVKTKRKKKLNVYVNLTAHRQESIMRHLNFASENAKI